MISVTIIIKNGERHLQKVLASVKHFAEVVLVDTGSTDKTIEIAKQFPYVRIFHRPFTGFGELHNEAASLATHDWILSLDGDEILSEQLQKELLKIPLNEDSVYSLPFHNYFNNKQIRTAGWYPERHVRLYHRKKTSFSNAKVHEKIECKNLNVIRLKHPVNHYSYETINDFLLKMDRYSTLFALQNEGRHNSSPMIAFYHGIGAFLKSYLIKRGIFGGYEGFLISAYNGHTAFYKYLKLYHLNKAKEYSSKQV